MLSYKYPHIIALLSVNAVSIVALPLLTYVQISLEGLIISFILYILMGGYGIGVVCHRYVTHNSFTFRNKYLKGLGYLAATVAGSGSILSWASVHRAHHKYSDTKLDPHSPTNSRLDVLTFKYVTEGIALPKRLLKDKWLIFTHRYYVAIVLLYVSLLCLFGWFTLYYAFIVPSFFVLIVSALTNYVQHTPSLGYPKAQDTNARNVWWMALINLGEGWHHNHHAKPRNYTTSNEWWEVDVIGLIIKLVGKERRYEQ